MLSIHFLQNIVDKTILFFFRKLESTKNISKSKMNKYEISLDKC